MIASVGLGKREKTATQFEKAPVASLTFQSFSSGGKSVHLNYKLRALNGEVTESGQISLHLKDWIPDHFALHPNYPNPFNPVTRIRFEVPELAKVEMTVYDILGREVTTLVDTRMKAGYHEVGWDGRDSQGNLVSSGMYIYSLKAKTFRANRKMILIR